MQVGFSAEGEIKGLDIDLYNNAGNSLDLSSSIMDRALLHTDNSYRIPAVRAVGHCCFTNQASNTAFRGFGGPQVRFCSIAFIVESRATYIQQALRICQGQLLLGVIVCTEVVCL